MATPLLQTKLYIPPLRPELVPRPRLIERLNAGLDRKLTLVSAPAGFGKPTLLSEWIHGGDAATAPLRAAWLSLDEDDNDPARFLAYFIAALQMVEENIGEGTPSALQSPQPPPIEAILTPLLNEIATIPNGFTLVLDDYHLIKAKPIHDALTFLLDHLPPPMRLVIATRQDPPLPLARLRGRGHMTEIRAGDLRFTEEEATAFLNQTMGLGLTPDEVSALEARTEGWIAGLHLAALSLKGEADRAAFIRAFAGDDRHVMDYLVSEVVSRQSEAVQRFLLHTAILERLCGPLCDAVLDSDGQPGSGQAILEYLEQANLFIVPLDNRRQWYRYHHLFADLLRHRLRRTVGAQGIAPLHRRASAWYAHNDMMSEAIAHSLVAKDWEQAAQLIGQAFDDMCCRGEYYTTMLSWLEMLPDEIVRARPSLGILYAWMLSINLQLDAVEPRLQEMERMADGQLPVDLRLQIAAIRATLARQRNDVAIAIELSHQVLKVLAEDPSDSNLLAYTGVVFNLAWTHLMEGDVVKARPRFSEARTLSQSAGSITLTLDAMRGLARVQILQGQLRQAVETYRQALQLADKVTQQSGQAVPAAAPVHLELADLLRERNQLDEAAHHLAQGIELSRQWQILGEDLRNSYVYQARLKQARGDAAGALDAIRQAEQLAQAYRAVPRFGDPIAACRAQLTLAQAVSIGGAFDPAWKRKRRHLEAVEQWAETRGLRADGSINLVDDEFEYVIWVRLLIAQNEPSQALQLLARLLQGAEDGGRTGRVIEILTLQALAQQALGDTDQALIALERALSLAEPEGYVRLFVDEGPPMARLLLRLCSGQVHEATARGIAPDYARRLLAVFEAETKDEEPALRRPPSVSRGEAEGLVEPLSERELEVLGLIAEGLTNQEIASRLFLALNTVKVHTRNIYGKLGVNSRTQAVAKARTLGILPSISTPPH